MGVVFYNARDAQVETKKRALNYYDNQHGFVSRLRHQMMLDKIRSMVCASQGHFTSRDVEIIITI